MKRRPDNHSMWRWRSFATLNPRREVVWIRAHLIVKSRLERKALIDYEDWHGNHANVSPTGP
eukprot:4815276-Amphidinium_carterae.1